MEVELRQRIVKRGTRKQMGIRSRPGALTARDVHTLAQIEETMRKIMLSTLLSGDPTSKAMPSLRKLLLLRTWMLLPMNIYIAVWRGGKNASFAALEGGDDDVYEHYGASRAHLSDLFMSLRAPETIKLLTKGSGSVCAEFAFILWLYRMKHKDSLTKMQLHFNMEWSRLLKCILAFQKWLFENHSFRVTNALHFWAPHIASFNAKFLALQHPPTGVYSRAYGCVDATLVPLCMPSPVMFATARMDGSYDLQIVDAEERFYCVYKHVHAIKFQALCLPNGIVADLSGVVLGRRHDSYLYEQCAMDERFYNHSFGC
jgi:hypothetical protein